MRRFLQAVRALFRPVRTSHAQYRAEWRRFVANVLGEEEADLR